MGSWLPAQCEPRPESETQEGYKRGTWALPEEAEPHLGMCTLSSSQWVVGQLRHLAGVTEVGPEGGNLTC